MLNAQRRSPASPSTSPFSFARVLSALLHSVTQKGCLQLICLPDSCQTRLISFPAHDKGFQYNPLSFLSSHLNGLIAGHRNASWWLFPLSHSPLISSLHQTLQSSPNLPKHLTKLNRLYWGLLLWAICLSVGFFLLTFKELPIFHILSNRAWAAVSTNIMAKAFLGYVQFLQQFYGFNSGVKIK